MQRCRRRSAPTSKFVQIDPSPVFWAGVSIWFSEFNIQVGDSTFSRNGAADENGNSTISIIAEDEANRRQTPENYFFHDFVRDAENYRQAIAIYESRKGINKAVKNRESPGDLHQFAHNPGEKESGYPRRRTIACGVGILFGGGRFLKRVGGLYMDIDKWRRRANGTRSPGGR